jgi:hypothetical protein
MDKKIKQYADQGNLTELKYIFVDSLDIDPTFESYEESYNYCKSIPGLLEQYVELTPFESDPSQWTEAYWGKLKMDLKKNFSDQRMSHMRKVAKVLMAEKVQRLTRDRQAAAAQPAAAPAQPKRPVSTASTTPKFQSQLPSSEEQTRKREEEKKQLEAENQRVINEQAAQKRALQAEAEKIKEENERLERQRQMDDARSKKAIGIAIAVAVAVAAVATIFLLLERHNWADEASLGQNLMAAPDQLMEQRNPEA